MLGLWIEQHEGARFWLGVMNELKPYELRDPAALIKGIADVVTLVEDTAWLALVHHPSTEQRLVRVDPLPVPALLDDDDEISPHLRAAAEAFDLFAPGVLVAVRHAADAFGGDIARDALIHLDQYKAAIAAVFGVLFQHGMGGSAGSCE